MYLIELNANKSSFKTVKFKKGVNFIVGGKHGEEDNNNNTYNGVGKSLMVKIIHFCLGCNTIKSFKEHLSDWEFSLKFEVNDKIYVAKRKCNDQSKIILNDEQMTVRNFNIFMGEILFNLDNVQYNYLTFRSLISRFIRPNKSSYNTYDNFIKKENEYSKNLCNGYLLGLDVYLINQKKTLIDRKKEIKSAEKIIKEDETILSFFKSNNIDVDIVDLEQDIKKLEQDIKNFKIAENYYEIKVEADNEQKELNDLENKILIIENAIENIDKSLNIKTDISKDKILLMYKEAKIEFNNIIIKKLQEVENFHNALLDNRKRRLLKQKNEFQVKLKNNKIRKKELSILLDSNLNLLGDYGALDEYNALNNKLNEYRNRLKKLNDYKNLVQEYKKEFNKINLELEKENILTNDYLKDKKDIINKNILIFRELSKRFYPNKTAGIQIDNNESNRNQNRFNISVEIQDDTSDGVNDIKIFCYDYTFLINRFNSNVNFIWHDSRLFSDIDPRQKKECIKIAYEYTKKYNLQYIATLNEDFMDTIKGSSDENEYNEIKHIVEDNTQLHLTDNDAAGKLLGIQVDLKYE